MTYQELQTAREVFGLGERVTLGEIRNRHRELVKRYHPDAGNPDHPGQIREVNAAYHVLLDYVTHYSFSFAKEEFYEQNPEERLRLQFMDDPLWGNG
jgi:DnaJ-class molecular chaperone